MANLTYSTKIQNRIAFNLFGSDYSSLTPAQKVGIDGTWTSGTVTDGHAKDAMQVITQMGQWPELTDGTTVSDAAEAWLVAEVTYRTALNVRPERISEFKELRTSAWKMYFDTVTTTAIPTGYGADPFVLTLQACRYHVLRRIANVKADQTTTVVPEEVDAETVWVLNWLWNKASWSFRRRLVTFTVTTSGTPSGSSPTIGTVSGEVFDKVATNRLYYSTFQPDFAQLATGETMAALKADNTADAGRPQYFRVERSAQTQTWWWHPYPDQTYTLYGEVLIRLPGTTTAGVPDSATDTVPFAKIPREFVQPFKELVLGRIMRTRGLGDQVWKDAVEELERFAPIYVDQGAPDLDGSVRDIYKDSASQQAITRMGYGYGQYGMGGAM